MIKQILTVIAMASVSMASHAADLPGEAAATLASFHAALAAGDKEKALTLLSPEVVIYESGYVERSRDEYARHHLADDMKFAKTTTQKVLKHSERLAGNTAVLWEETETTGAANGKPVHLMGTTTAVLEQSGGRWLIAHLHWSSRKAK